MAGSVTAVKRPSCDLCWTAHRQVEDGGWVPECDCDTPAGRLVLLSMEAAWAEGNLEAAGLFGREGDAAEQWLLPDNQPIFAELRRTVSEGAWPLLVGPPGSGKTYLAQILVIERAKKDAHLQAVNRRRGVGEKELEGYFTGRLIQWNELLLQIRSTYGRQSGDSEYSILEGLHEADPLVIDDLGAEYQKGGSSWAPAILQSLVEGRYRRRDGDGGGAVTIITTNLEPDQLKEHMDPRTFSRLTAMVQVIRLPKRDLRVLERDGMLPKVDGA